MHELPPKQHSIGWKRERSAVEANFPTYHFEEPKDGVIQ